MLRMTRLASLMTLSLLGASAANATNTTANAVVEWNEIAMTAVTAQRPGPQSMLDISLVQIAVHDAVQSIEQRFEPYNVEIKGAKGSRTAAVAAAAHGVLVGMYQGTPQETQVETAYLQYIANRGLVGDPGLELGHAVAERILPLRRKTPNPEPEFVGGTEIGQWRPEGTNTKMVTPWLGATDPFTLTGPARFRADPPPALTSERYRKDYDEVKALGSINSTRRTAEQTDLAHFYNDNFFNQWNRTLRSLAMRYHLNTGDTARLFALANMAAADALITCWDSKTHYAIWRPSTAIQFGDFDGNPKTVGDPSWQPLTPNPSYPDYTSGANSLIGAMTRTMELFFGTDHKTFEVTSLNPNVVKTSRMYRRFSDASADAVEARIYLGIHFRFADVAARDQGRKVADWAFKHFLLPKDRKDHKDHKGHKDHDHGHGPMKMTGLID
jgi:hypothetical protein